MDEPQVERTNSKKGVQFVVVKSGKILYGVQSRKLAFRLLNDICHKKEKGKH